MDDFRSPGYSASPTLFKASKIWSFAPSIASLKDQIEDLATSCSSVFAESKTSVGTFLDDAKSTAGNSFRSIQRMFSDGGSDMEQYEKCIRSNSMRTRSFGGIPLNKRENRRMYNSLSQNTGSSIEDSAFSSLREDISLPSQSSFTENESLSSLSSFERDAEMQVHYQLQSSTGVANRKMCSDWMMSIPEEGSPKSVRKSKLEFGMNESRRNGDTFQELKRNGKTFVRINSEPVKHNNSICHTEEIPGNFEAVEPIKQSNDEIRAAIMTVLDGLGHGKLDFIMRQTDTEEENTNSQEDNYKVTTNTIPESEQYFKRSPHVKRRHAVSPKCTPQLQDYMSIKTDIYTKSAKVSDVSVGAINISIQYLITTERLKVTIEKVRSLNQRCKQKEKNRIFVEVTVVPQRNRNKGRQTQALRIDDPVIFNHDMYFENMTIENVHLQCLRFGVYRKATLFTKRDKCIGECFVYLDELDVVRKVNMSERLISCE